MGCPSNSTRARRATSSRRVIPGFRGALRATAGRRRIAAAALVGLLVVAVVAATVGGVPGGDSGADRTLVVTYENSVEKTLVRDVYVATNDGLRMTRMEFSSFGAGLPSRADVTERDGRYVYYPPPTEYRTLHLKTGIVADHDLIVGDRRYDITRMSGGGAVELTVERRGLFRL